MKTPSEINKKGVILNNIELKDDSYYIVDVAYASTNPIHRSILFTGFLDKDKLPGAYSAIFCNGDIEPAKDAYYISYISKIDLWKKT